MVKKLSYVIGLGLPLALCAYIVGCKSANPVVPANAAVLSLSLPPQILATLSGSKNAFHKDPVPDSNQGALEYYLSAPGEAPVTGVIYYNSGSQVGNIFINLPKAGVWLVSAEWFYLFNEADDAKKGRAKVPVPSGYEAEPEFVGADEVNVQGTTSFTLNMEQINNQTEGVCYNGTLTDPTDCDYLLNGVWVDLYSFNTGVEAASNTSVATTTGDIQALYDPVTTQSTYLGSSTGASYAYLGNGDLVNFPIVPANATFYPNTLAAKGAVLGAASAAITIYDVFVIKGPEPNQMVWFQPWVDNNECTAGPGGSSLMQFWFIYNNEGLNYMKFDQTAEGLAYCNQNVPTPIPTTVP
jgi:hypothetical protein